MTQGARFISLEGGEGSGKSTNIRFIADYLQSHGVRVLVTREPGGTSLGEALRELLLSPDNHEISQDTELLLMFAARSQHVHEVIRPALARGDWVISDRFTDSSYAYQGSARGIPLKRLDVLAEWTLGSLKPDLTFYLDIDPHIGMTRARERAALDRFEREQMAFFEKVRSGFRLRAEQDPERMKLIDASQDLNAVQSELQNYLDRLIDPA